MATHAKPKPSQIYDEDFYAWSKEQADLLRTKRFAELDLGNLIEQVDDLGGALLEDRSVRLSKAKGIVLASLAVALSMGDLSPWACAHRVAVRGTGHGGPGIRVHRIDRSI